MFGLIPPPWSAFIRLNCNYLFIHVDDSLTDVDYTYIVCLDVQNAGTKTQTRHMTYPGCLYGRRKDARADFGNSPSKLRPSMGSNNVATERPFDELNFL